MCEASNAFVHGDPSLKDDLISSSLMTSVASLLTDVLAKSFTDYHPEKYKRASEASQAGINGTDCSVAYPKCSLDPLHRPQPQLFLKS